MNKKLENKLKKKLRVIPDFPKKGILFQDITSITDNKKLFKEVVLDISKYIKRNKLLVGYNFFYDLDLDNSHERFGIGADMLTSLGDVHLNYYDAITDYVVVNGLKEYTLDGFDAQIAFPLPYLPRSKIYAEVFSWNGINSSRDLEGETFSIKNKLPYGMSLEFGKTSFDQLSRDEEFVTLNINLF